MRNDLWTYIQIPQQIEETILSIAHPFKIILYGADMDWMLIERLKCVFPIRSHGANPCVFVLERAYGTNKNTVQPSS